MVFEFGDDVFIEQQAGDGGSWIGEVFIESGLLDEIPNHLYYNSNITQSFPYFIQILSYILERPRLTIFSIFFCLLSLRELISLIVAVAEFRLTGFLPVLPVTHIAVIDSVLVDA